MFEQIIHILPPLLCYILWIYLLYCYRKYLLNKYILINIGIIFLPLLIIIKHIYSMIVYDNSMMENWTMKKQDMEIAGVIPILIFGLGLLLSRHKTYVKGLKTIVPFLIISLIFGTILPYILMFIESPYSENNKNNILAITFKHIIYCSIVIAGTSLFMGVILTFMILYS